MRGDRGSSWHVSQHFDVTLDPEPLPLPATSVPLRQSRIRTPIGTDAEMLKDWSSFPSDHAALVFSLSTAIWHVSRPLGVLCYAWSTFVVCLPRVYEGYHYASDVLGGALIGIGAVLCVRMLLPTRALTDATNGLAERYPGLFNTGFFGLLFLFTTLFDDIRVAARALFRHVLGP